MRNGKSWGLRAACLTAALAVIALVVLEETKIGAGRFFFEIKGRSIKERANRIPFNSSDWKNPKLANADIRIRMVDDLLITHQMVGITRTQVQYLLGKPWNTHTPERYEYYLGPDRGWGIDSEILVITFDKSDRVKSVKVEVT